MRDIAAARERVEKLRAELERRFADWLDDPRHGAWGHHAEGALEEIRDEYRREWSALNDMETAELRKWAHAVASRRATAAAERLTMNANATTEG